MKKLLTILFLSVIFVACEKEQELPIWQPELPSYDYQNEYFPYVQYRTSEAGYFSSRQGNFTFHEEYIQSSDFGEIQGQWTDLHEFKGFILNEPVVIQHEKTFVKITFVEEINKMYLYGR